MTDNQNCAATPSSFELLRLGLKQEVQQQGRRKLVELRKFLDRCTALGLDERAGAGWNLKALGFENVMLLPRE